MVEYQKGEDRNGDRGEDEAYATEKAANDNFRRRMHCGSPFTAEPPAASAAGGYRAVKG